jgi:hypothetical protein
VNDGTVGAGALKLDRQFRDPYLSVAKLLSAALINANSSVWLISIVRVTFFSLSFNRGGNDRKSLSIHGAIPCSGATEIVGSKCLLPRH